MRTFAKSLELSFDFSLLSPSPNIYFPRKFEFSDLKFLLLQVIDYVVVITVAPSGLKDPLGGRTPAGTTECRSESR